MIEPSLPLYPFNNLCICTDNLYAEQGNPIYVAKESKK
ncbi:hypothetical protein FTV88_2511 [Heliorestis convoluta]|uniref:Uncharacterized protein n=1 Tax=Heliorestis convoluta TaxID=356322 RepID=A0A5Q2N010_9FIRM|nr:hypothetical protein FTV88_2511 [Heliorestis convoluta]